MKVILKDIQKNALNNIRQLSYGLNLYNAQKLNVDFAGTNVWQQGGSVLYKYPGSGFPLIFVPSLINKANILDLSPKRSLLLKLSRLGVRPYLLDWGAPGESEKGFTLESYIDRLSNCINYLYTKTRAPLALAGYCMGGQLALAAAIINAKCINKFIAIATPWDFSNFWLAKSTNCWDFINSLPDPVPSFYLQLLFYFNNFTGINNKFIRYGKGEYNNQEFIQIENWVNDGVPISKNVLLSCFKEFINANILAQGQWKVRNKIIKPGNLKVPALCAIAENDTIAPLSACKALYNDLRYPALFTSRSGHVSMIINPKHKLAERIESFIKSPDYSHLL